MGKLANLRHLVSTLLLVSAAAHAVPDVQVQGLMAGQAVVSINGKQHILKQGKTGPEGISLIEASSTKAIFEWRGERFERSLSRNISSNYSERTSRDEVRIPRGQGNHFYTKGLINGRPVNFMVDTGAFAIAMTPTVADSIGLNWRKGQRFIADTAGGGTPSYKLTLDSVTVGDITLRNIVGAVVVAESPSDNVLLGMSFLEKTEMREENNTLVLRKKY